MEFKSEDDDKSVKTTEINDHDSESHIFRFEPALYIQRYDYIADILNKYKCSTYLDIGCNNCKLIKYLKNSNEYLNLIIGIDIDDVVLKNGNEYLSPSWFDYLKPRVQPLDVYLIKADISEPSDFLVEQIGYESTGLECVSMVEVIEHMYPEVLEKAINTVFVKLKPQIVVMTTPNSDFNVVFDDMDKENNDPDRSQTEKPKFRHWDHKFEWTRYEFQSWCQSLLEKYAEYELVCYDGRGLGPEAYTDIGFCSQIALFKKKEKLMSESQPIKEYQKYLTKKSQLNFVNRMKRMKDEESIITEPFIKSDLLEAAGKEEIYASIQYPFDLFEFENEELRNQAILEELNCLIRFVKPAKVESFYGENVSLTDEDKEKIENNIELDCKKVYLCSVEKLFSYPSIEKFNLSTNDLMDIIQNKYEFTKSNKYIIYETADCETSSTSESGYQNEEQNESYVSFEHSNNRHSEEDWDNDVQVNAEQNESHAYNNGFSEEDWEDEIQVKTERVYTPEEQFGDDANSIIFSNPKTKNIEDLTANLASLNSTISTDASENSDDLNKFEVNYFTMKAKELAEHFKNIRRGIRREERRRLRKETNIESKITEQFSNDFY